jgi:hypothetical protein
VDAGFVGMRDLGAVEREFGHGELVVTR